MNICVYASSCDGIAPVYKKQARALGREIALRGHRLVYGGGRCGLMGATARGALDAGGCVTGIVPELFNIDGGQLEGLSEFIHVSSMSARKQKMRELADAFVVLPGGVGTFDELFETLTLKSLDENRAPIALLNTSGFYKQFLESLSLFASHGFIKPETLAMLYVSRSIPAVLDYLNAAAAQ